MVDVSNQHWNEDGSITINKLMPSILIKKGRAKALPLSQKIAPPSTSLGMTRQCVGLTLTGGRNILMAERIP